MLRLSLLGGLSLAGDGQALGPAAAQPRRLALLAVLAAAGERGVSRDRLMLLFWPESDTESARNALKQAVFALRHDLDAPDLITGTTELHLNRAHLTCDLWDFQAALAAGDDATAVAAYIGPFLDGVHLDGAPEFDEWAETQRTSLARQHAEVLGRVAERAEQAGAHVEAARWWRRLVELQPLEARATLGLMHALAAAGDRAGALSAAAAHEAAVRRDLDSPAEPEVLELAARIRSGHWQPGVPGRLPLGSPAPASLQDPTAVPGPIRLPVARRTRRRVVALATATVVVLGIGAALSAIGPLHAARHTAVVSQPLVVVEPFTGHATDSSLAELGAILQDAVTTDLSRLGSITVELGSEAAPRSDAAYRVVGTFMEVDGKLDLTASVIARASSAAPLLIQPIAVSAGDALAGLDTVRQRVAAAVESLVNTPDSSLLWSPGEELPPTVEAYSRFIEGLRQWFSPGGGGQGALRTLRSAVDAETTYALPLVWISKIYRELGNCDSAMSVARAADSHVRWPIERAYLEMQVTRCEGDWVGYEHASQDLLRAAPGAPFARSIAVAGAAAAGHFRRADSLVRSLPLPLDPLYAEQIHWTYHGLRQFTIERTWLLAALARTGDQWGAYPLTYVAECYGAERMVRQADSVLQVIANLPGGTDYNFGETSRRVAIELVVNGHAADAPRFFLQAANWYAERLRAGLKPTVRSMAARAFLNAGDYAEAENQFHAILRRPPSEREDEDAWGGLGLIAAWRRDTGFALRAAQWLNGRPLRLSYGNPIMWQARIALALGHPERALMLIREAIDHGYPISAETADDIEPIYRLTDLAPLHSDAGFQELVQPH